jgi:hypothetical protein
MSDVKAQHGYARPTIAASLVREPKRLLPPPMSP